MDNRFNMAAKYTETTQEKKEKTCTCHTIQNGKKMKEKKNAHDSMNACMNDEETQKPFALKN